MVKKLAVTLSIVILLGIILPGPPALARPARTPHENPEKAADSFDIASLLLTYSQVAVQAANRRYQSARETLAELDKVAPPADITFMLEQYNSLNDKLYASLDGLEALLNQATDLLSRNRAGEARQCLDSSGGAVQGAKDLLQETRAATRTLGDKLGVSGSPAGDRLAQAFSRLEASAARLSDLIARLEKTRLTLNEQYLDLTDLAPTSISLDISRKSVYVGERVTATGRLDCGKRPLAAKKICLTADNRTVGTALTGPDGSYNASFAIPYLYKNDISFTAEYEPADKDKELFLASQSPPVDVSARFNPTRCAIAVPAMVYLGLPFILSGEVSTGAEITSRRITVSLDDMELAEADVAGRFSIEVTIPPEAAPGRRALTINVAPAGSYAGVVRRQGVNLAAPLLHIEVGTAGAVILPGTVKVAGKITSGPDPLGDAPVLLQLMGATATVRTAADGSFSGTLKIHALPSATLWDLSPANAHDIKITAAIPSYPATTRTVPARLVTFNPLSALPLLGLMVWLALALYRKKHAPAMPDASITAPEESRPPVAAPAPAPPPAALSRYGGIRGRIFSAYRSGLKAVERITGVIMAPSVTLREFHENTRLPSPETAGPFAELTTIAESSLYSAGDPPDVIADRAEELAGIIEEDLRRGRP